MEGYIFILKFSKGFVLNKPYPSPQGQNKIYEKRYIL